MGWLLVLIVSVAWVAMQDVPALPLTAALVGMFVLGVLYVRLTLRGSIGPADLALDGPPRAVVRARLLQLGVMTLTVTVLVLIPPNAEAWWLSMFIIIAAGLALPPTLACAVITILVTATLIVARLMGRFDPMLLIMIPFGAAAIAVRQLTISVAQLGAAREELARTAVDQERFRFARDLHDILGHTLSVIILKSELASRLLPREPKQAAAELADIERSAREAQRQVRAAVVGYRQPDLQHELAGARELLTAAGVEPNVRHAIPQLPAALDALLAWAVREGVTNVVRHSRARHCDIQLVQQDGAIQLIVADDGQSRGQPPNVGSGLAGLAERASAHGATIEAGPRPEGGFRLAVTAPLAATAP